jgi:chromosome segregation ATPase
MPWGDVVAVGGFILAAITGFGTYRLSKKKEDIADRISAIDGFDKLTKGQRTELEETKKDLRETRDELHTAEDRIQKQDLLIGNLRTEVTSLKRQVAILEGKAEG